MFSDDSPWSLERFNKAKVGEASREGVLYFEVPSNYDPNAAPEGKQIFMTGSFCPANPDMSKEEIAAWANTGEEILFKAFPELEGAIEDKDLYTTRDVSNLTRDSVRSPGKAEKPSAWDRSWASAVPPSLRSRLQSAASISWEPTPVAPE